jgi:deazaflavin-dependent oxidoreductase (nitroreductase family)
MPVLELTTTGRKSGESRSVMLTSQEGDTIVIVASRGGDDHHLAWYLNLRDQPRVEVAFKGGARAPYTARVATTDERTRLWPQVTATYKGYAGYPAQDRPRDPTRAARPRTLIPPSTGRR